MTHPEKIVLKKFPFPSENKTYASAQTNNRQKSAAMQTPKPLTGQFFSYSVDRRPVCNSTYKKLAVHCFNQSLSIYQKLCMVENKILLNRPLLYL